MNSITTNTPKDLPKAIFELMFHHTNVCYKDKKLKFTFAKSKEGDFIKKIQVDNYVYIQQHPRSISPMQKGPSGANIMWVVDVKTNKYVAKVESNGVTILS